MTTSCECASLDLCVLSDRLSAIDVKSEIGIFSEHDFQHLANIVVVEIVFIQQVWASGSNCKAREQASKQKVLGKQSLQRDRRLRRWHRSTRATQAWWNGEEKEQSKSKEVVGGGLGMDSSADKGARRKQVHFEGVEGKVLSLKHAFGCVDK